MKVGHLRDIIETQDDDKPLVVRLIHPAGEEIFQNIITIDSYEDALVLTIVAKEQTA